eukprot:313180-Chlamydomonas_euryale.AAC.2
MSRAIFVGRAHKRRVSWSSALCDHALLRSRVSPIKRRLPAQGTLRTPRQNGLAGRYICRGRG